MKNPNIMTISMTGVCNDLTSAFNFSNEHKDVAAFIGISIHPDAMRNGVEVHHIETMVHGEMRVVDFMNAINALFKRAIEHIPARMIANKVINLINKGFNEAIEKQFKGMDEPSVRELFKQMIDALKGKDEE